MKKLNVPFDVSTSSLVLVYSNGERYHVENATINEDNLDYNSALQVTTFAYITAKLSSKIKAKGIHADTLTEQEIIIDAVKSGLAFVVVAPCPLCDGNESAKVYTCAGIRSSVSGEDISFIADALAFGLNS